MRRSRRALYSPSVPSLTREPLQSASIKATGSASEIPPDNHSLKRKIGQLGTGIAHTNAVTYYTGASASRGGDARPARRVCRFSRPHTVPCLRQDLGRTRSKDIAIRPDEDRFSAMFREPSFQLGFKRNELRIVEHDRFQIIVLAICP